MKYWLVPVRCMLLQYCAERGVGADVFFENVSRKHVRLQYSEVINKSKAGYSFAAGNK